MSLDSSGLIQKKKIGEIGESRGVASDLIIGEMLQVKGLQERRERFDFFLEVLGDQLAAFLRDDPDTESYTSLGVTVIATAMVRQQFQLTGENENRRPPSVRLRAEFGEDMASIARRLGMPAFDAIVLSARSEALFEAKSALFALTRSGTDLKFNGLVSAGGMSSQLVWFDQMKPASIDMAWKPVITYGLEAAVIPNAEDPEATKTDACPHTTLSSKVEAMKKEQVKDPEVLRRLRNAWAARFISSKERSRILAENAACLRQNGLEDAAAEQPLSGRWVFISGLVAFFGALGLVPAERLGGFQAPADAANVRAYFFGEKYGSSYSPPAVFTTLEVREFLEVFFSRVPTIWADEAVKNEEASMKKALSSAAQYMRVATAIHLEAMLGLFTDSAEIYFSKAEMHVHSGKTVEYSVNVGYALDILERGAYGAESELLEESESEEQPTL